MASKKKRSSRSSRGPKKRGSRSTRRAQARRLVWEPMDGYEHAKSMRTVLVIYPGRRGGFDLFDSATRLGHYRTKKKAKAAAERRHTSLQMLGITRG